MEFFYSGYSQYDPPIEFKEKHSNLLKSLYESGGKENKKFILESTLQAPLAYASRNEFVRIIEYLQKPNWIEFLR
jgi:hypothetical protein